MVLLKSANDWTPNSPVARRRRLLSCNVPSVPWPRRFSRFHWRGNVWGPMISPKQRGEKWGKNGEMGSDTMG